MSRITLFCDIIVPLGVPNKYTYRVPFEFNGLVECGKRVLVQFGKTRIYTGIIYAIHENAPTKYEAKYLEGVLDEVPILTPTQLQLWDWMSFYYCANPGDVMNSALPSGLKLSSSSTIQLNKEFNFEGCDASFFSEREHQVLDVLHAKHQLSFTEIAELIKIKSPQNLVNGLLRKNAIEVFEEVKDKYKPKLSAFLKLNTEYEDEAKLNELLNVLEKKAFKQAEALLYFLHLSKSDRSKEWILKNELLKRSENAALNALVKKKILLEEKFEIGRLLFEKGKKGQKQLSVDQRQAYKEITEGFAANKPVLLHGVTGSGKTEIYMELIADALSRGEQVLFLIPEIALTTQLIGRLRAVFGEIVGVYHSRFSENERVEIWNNVLSSHTKTVEPDKRHYQIILGARSCLFLPFSKLGLIIVDEEHDPSFKQYDPAPRYHARDSALYLASLHQARVLLGSATPSVESYFNCESGKYSLVKLKDQFVTGGGTDLVVSDTIMYGQRNQMKTSLTPPLFDAITEALKNKEQIILFQNRRGFAPYTECNDCGHVPHCIQCDVSLIYHKNRQKLVCHYCGYQENPPSTCVACGSNKLFYKGLGTEKIEEDVQIIFPEAKIVRMDLDSTRSKYAYKQIIDEFESGAVDILVGTQMVTKGLDFGNVSVVGVLNADSLLNFPDFRSFERAFQLLTQVRGRAGRGKKKGHFIVQTTQKDHPVVKLVEQNNYDAFFISCLSERKQFNYPPFSRLFEINIISKDINEVNHLSSELASLLRTHFSEQVLGPEFPLISKIKNQYYKRIVIKTSKSESPASVRNNVTEALNTLQHNYQQWKYRVSIDVDPL